jgi:GAF domain-containing protein
MPTSLVARQLNFLPLGVAMFCTQCELISQNNTPRCVACGSLAVLSLSRVLGGSLRGQQSARLIQDAELNNTVRSLIDVVPQNVLNDEHSAELPVAASLASRHGLRLCGTPQLVSEINPEELELEPGISIIAEKAQAMTNATGAAVALRHGNEIICRARTGCTAPDLGARLENDSSMSAECIRTGQVLLCNDAETNSGVDRFTCRRLGARSILASPLRRSERTLGVLEVLSSQPNAFDHDDIAILGSLSIMMMAAMSQRSSVRSARMGIAVGQ